MKKYLHVWKKVISKFLAIDVKNALRPSGDNGTQWEFDSFWNT